MPVVLQVPTVSGAAGTEAAAAAVGAGLTAAGGAPADSLLSVPSGGCGLFVLLGVLTYDGGWKFGCGSWQLLIVPCTTVNCRQTNRRQGKGCLLVSPNDNDASCTSLFCCCLQVTLHRPLLVVVLVVVARALLSKACQLQQQGA